MMRCAFLCCLTVVLLVLDTHVIAQRQQPNIVIIVADDLGFNDVGYHGSTQIPTPNIDALAYSGLILNNYYVQPICTPSRSALLTGKHPIHTGMYHYTIGGAQPYGLSLSETLLPEHLKSLGYVNHHVGKWHLGFFKQDYTPGFRGFSSHFGYWSGRIDYNDHTSFEHPGFWGYDMRRNMDVASDAYGKYATDLFTEEAVNVINEHNKSQPLFLYLAHLAVHSGNPYAPLQAPADVVAKFAYIKNENRRKFAGMIWKLDESVGQVVEALRANQMLHNSIILFSTDNGGPAAGFNQNAASNWPLRGVKASVWEGGVRGAGLLWSPYIVNPGRVSHQMIHITDWLPTFISAAGGDPSSLESIDGQDLWEILTQNLPSPRTEFLVNIDPRLNSAAIRVGDWKLLYNPQAYGHHWDFWFGPSGRNETAPETQLDVILEQVKSSLAAKAIKTINPEAFTDMKSLRLQSEIHCDPVPENATLTCDSQEYPCLFHIPSDPCEYHNLATAYPSHVNILRAKLRLYNATVVPPRNKPWDSKANPKYWGYSWTNWLDYSPPTLSTQSSELSDSFEFYDLYGDFRN
ncbi:arylsulfatase B-like isoform X2 [Portunus trituberculatus]|uniref:arylsulfatase B-like isoform X2 n=2 Tax=Portunus trituberculatus TaxID=210409 RepID=UPI001E1CDBA9|nr:arylsulfatase B-like isoform X2 [Portunus trituberculatus]